MSWIRRGQKKVIEAAAVVSAKASVVVDEAKIGLKKLDDKHAIIDKLKKTGDTTAVLAQQVDQHHDIFGKAGNVMKTAAEVASRAREAALRKAEESGLNR
jgi:hypothetical protein